MAQDIQIIYGILAAIAVLCALVYLMYKEGSKSTWKEISQSAKKKIHKE